MDLEAQRIAAGEQAAQLVQDGMVIGYGTGRAATAALEALARRKVRVRGVPTSQKTVQICQRLGLSLVALEDHPRLDLVIDGADEVDPRAQLIKGGGGAHAPEIAFWMRAGFAEASSNTTVMVFASRSDETRTTPLTFCTADSVL